MSQDNQQTDSKLFKIVESLKKEINPTRLFLYGSRANGNARPDSDYDFVAVVPQFESKKRVEMMSKISSKLWQDLDVEVQVWVYSQAEFDDWKDEFSSIPETALNTGIEVQLG
jgi:predicted nucleotidyltransferase